MTSTPSLACWRPAHRRYQILLRETGVGIVRGMNCWPMKGSSVELHVRFGGVVPEVASRAHLEAMVPTLQRACASADIDLSEIDGVALPRAQA